MNIIPQNNRVLITLTNTQMIQKFKDYIKTTLGTKYKDTDTFTKEDDIYVVTVPPNDGRKEGKYKYKKEGTIFTFIK